MMSNLSQFIKDSSWSLVSLSAASAAQFILRIFLARYFGPADLGLYTMAFTFYSYGLVFTAFGTDYGLTKYVAETGVDSVRVKNLLSAGVTVSFLSGCIMGLALYLASPWITNFFFKMPGLTELLQIVSISFPFIALEKSALGFLNGLRRMKFYALINIIQNTSVVILTLLFAVAGYGLKYAVLGLVLPLVFVSLISLFSLRKYFSWPVMPQYSQIARMLLVFGLFLVLDNGIGSIQMYIDSTLLGYFMKDVDVGIYAVAGILYFGLSLPPKAIQTITGPMLARYWYNNESRMIEDLVNKCMKYSTFFTVLISFTACFLSYDLINLFFGRDFTAAALPFQILLIGVIFGGMLSPIGSALESTSYVKVGYKLTGLVFLINVFLDIFLIPRFGITGAAVASSSTTVISSLVRLYAIQRLVKIRIDWLWFAKISGFTMIIAATTYAAGMFFNPYICTILGLILLMLVTGRYLIPTEDLGKIMSVLREWI